MQTLPSRWEFANLRPRMTLHCLEHSESHVFLYLLLPKLFTANIIVRCCALKRKSDQKCVDSRISVCAICSERTECMYCSVINCRTMKQRDEMGNGRDQNHMLFALVLTMTEISGMARARHTGERHRLTWYSSRSPDLFHEAHSRLLRCSSCTPSPKHRVHDSILLSVYNIHISVIDGACAHVVVRSYRSVACAGQSQIPGRKQGEKPG